MRILVIASHGGLAEGAVDSARMILGDSAEVITYSLLPGESAADFAAILQKRIETEPHNEFVIAADLYGASVCTSLCTLTIYPNVRLFAGFNLCLLLELLSAGGDSPMTDEDAAELIELGKKGLREVKLTKRTAVAEEDF